MTTLLDQQETDSLASLLSSLTRSKGATLESLLSGFSESECEALLHDWTFWARGRQLQPTDNWLIWLILTGRGWGKTRTGAETVRDFAERGKTSRVALVAATAADYRDVMVEGDSGLLATADPKFAPEWTPSRRKLEWPNGVVAYCYSAEEPERLRGPQHGLAWCDEVGAWKYAKKTWDNLSFGLRLQPGKTIITTTPRTIPLLIQLMGDERTHLTGGSTYENVANLSDAYKSHIIKPYEGTRIGRQELYGNLLLDTPGALWTHELIDQYRADSQSQALQTLSRIVVAIDPAVTSGEDSHETGIVVAGVGQCDCRGTSERHAFVLDDLSLKGTPLDWANRAIEGYHNWSADRVVAEINNGGEMVEVTLGAVSRDIPYRPVRASRGKVRRAEPISALYEQGKIHHVGLFSTLEDQMCSLVDAEGGDDRVDALVWALTELMSDSASFWPYDPEPVASKVGRPQMAGLGRREF